MDKAKEEETAELPDLENGKTGEQEPDKNAKGNDKEETRQTELNEKAKTMGWKPLDDFEGDPDIWVDSAEFVRRQPLFDEIHKWKRRYTDLEKTIDKFKDHNKKIEEVAYKKAMGDLKQQKIKALEEGDHAKVVELDDEIADKKFNHKPEDQEPSPFAKWADDNKWYEEDPLMADFADNAGRRYAALHKGASPVEILEYAAEAAKKKYPEKFGVKNQNRDRPSAVEGTKPSGKQVSKWDQLNDEEKHIAMQFVRDGFISKEKYAEDYLSIKRMS